MGINTLRKILVEAAWSAARTKDSRFMKMYQRLLARGKKQTKSTNCSCKEVTCSDLEYVIKKKRLSIQNIKEEYKQHKLKLY